MTSSLTRPRFVISDWIASFSRDRHFDPYNLPHSPPLFFPTEHSALSPNRITHQENSRGCCKRKIVLLAVLCYFCLGCLVTAITVPLVLILPRKKGAELLKTKTHTNTLTPTETPTHTLTHRQTRTPSETPTHTLTHRKTRTPSETPTHTLTHRKTQTHTETLTRTKTFAPCSQFSAPLSSCAGIVRGVRKFFSAICPPPPPLTNVICSSTDGILDITAQGSHVVSPSGLFCVRGDGSVPIGEIASTNSSGCFLGYDLKFQTNTDVAYVPLIESRRSARAKASPPLPLSRTHSVQHAEATANTNIVLVLCGLLGIFIVFRLIRRIVNLLKENFGIRNRQIES